MRREFDKQKEETELIEQLRKVKTLSKRLIFLILKLLIFRLLKVVLKCRCQKTLHQL